VRRLVPPRGKACSACNMELRPSESSKLEDPRALVRCVHCNVLLAAGPPEGLFDG
jgi:predicted  nucleic acid-binding Zn-ribbon protein